MKKILALALLLTPAMAFAGNGGDDVADQRQAVIMDTAPVILINISSFTPTLVESPQLSGSWVEEVQNLDASNDICCAFRVDFSTVTTSNQTKSCRRVIHGGGTWSVSRWWQRLVMYCQTLSTTGTSPVALVQGK